MYDEESKLKSKIYYFEDAMLRSKDVHEQERIRVELQKMRKRLQQLNWDKQRKGL